MNEKFDKNTKVEQLTKMFLTRGEEKCLTVKDPLLKSQKTSMMMSAASKIWGEVRFVYCDTTRKHIQNLPEKANI